MTRTLVGKVIVVTGASRGIGRGIALGLGEAGATVYITGRTVQKGSGDWPGTIHETADEVTRLGGHGIALQCDHRDDAQVHGVFRQVQQEQGRLDVLVNNATAVPLPSQLPDGVASFWKLHPFWVAPIELWDQLLSVGMRSHYVASVYAAPIMVAQRDGAIINISSRGALTYSGYVAYHVGKAGVEKLTAAMAQDLRPFSVAAMSLWPPLTKIESVVGQPEVYPDLSRAASPLFNGRVVAALVADPKVMEKTGQALDVRELAQEYGVVDPDAE